MQLTEQENTTTGSQTKHFGRETLVPRSNTLCPRDLDESGVRPVSGTGQLDTRLDHVDCGVSIATLRNGEGSSHGVLNVVPTKPPAVPAIKLLRSSCFLLVGLGSNPFMKWMTPKYPAFHHT